jgi:peptide/nickel transport system substrate-binding protein
VKKLLLLILVVVVVLGGLLLRQKSTEPQRGRAAVVAFENEVPSVDPIRLSDVFGLRVAYQIVEGLTKLDADNKIVNAVAESSTHSPDFKTWTFRLRRGIRFHPHPALDAETATLTASDVEYSFTRMLSKEAVTAGPLATVLAGAKEYQAGESPTVSGIRVVSPEEIEFTLIRPDSMFPGRISSPAYGIVSRKVVEAAGTNFGQTVISGTGPFRFIGREGNDLVLERFSDYREKAAGAVSRVIFRTIKEDPVRLADARAGRLTVTYATAPMLQGVAEKRGDNYVLSGSGSELLDLQSFPIFSSYFIAFNSPRVDANLRKAINLALNREEFVAAAVPLSGQAAAGPIPLACAGYRTLVSPEQNLDAAKAGLAAYRQTHPETPIRLNLLTHELAQAVPIGEVAQSQLKNIGIEVNLVRQSFTAVLEIIRKGDFDATVLGFEYQYSEPALILENFYTAAAIPLPNVFHYNNPATDAAIAALFSAPESPEQTQKVAEIEKRIVDDAPGAFLYQTRQLILLSKNIQGVRFNAANFPDFSVASWR